MSTGVRTDTLPRKRREILKLPFLYEKIYWCTKSLCTKKSQKDSVHISCQLATYSYLYPSSLLKNLCTCLSHYIHLLPEKVKEGGERVLNYDNQSRISKSKLFLFCDMRSIILLVVNALVFPRQSHWQHYTCTLTVLGQHFLISALSLLCSGDLLVEWNYFYCVNSR